MSLTIFIIIGIIISIIISAFNRLAGAVASLILITGILFYGLDAYRTPDWAITILNIPVSKKVFLIFIAVCYFFAAIELIVAIRQKRRRR